jgi:hypothetical protein
MKKSNVLRLVSKLVTLGVLAGCLLVVAPAREAKAGWIDCLSDWAYCQYNCGDLSSGGADGCLDQCGQAMFTCEAGSGSDDGGFKIVP